MNQSGGTFVPAQEIHLPRATTPLSIDSPRTPTPILKMMRIISSGFGAGKSTRGPMSEHLTRPHQAVAQGALLPEAESHNAIVFLEGWLAAKGGHPQISPYPFTHHGYNDQWHKGWEAYKKAPPDEK